MKTLKQQIAEAIITACDADKKPMPERLRLQIPSGGYSRIVAFFDVTHHEDPFERSRVGEYKQFKVDLPAGYSEDEYEEALDELFPGALANDATVPRHNSSVRVVTRKKFEDFLVG